MIRTYPILEPHIHTNMTAEVSHGRGGAGNIAVDDTQYVDGSIVRTGDVGSHGDGAYSAGRGGMFPTPSPSHRYYLSSSLSSGQLLIVSFRLTSLNQAPETLAMWAPSHRSERMPTWSLSRLSARLTARTATLAEAAPATSHPRLRPRAVPSHPRPLASPIS